MKKWGWAVGGLYAVALALAMPPLQLAAFAGKVSLSDAFSTWATWQFWGCVVLMALAQVIFLAVPVRFASRRPVSRLTLLAPIAVTALAVAALAVGLSLSLIEFIFGAHAPDAWQLAPVGLALLAWIAWALVFWRMSATRAPEAVVRAQASTLLKGSVLELLVAVPTHVVARWRDYCCAGLMTFIGLACGIAVMLFAFGPGVFFLYLARWRRLHPEAG